MTIPAADDLQVEVTSDWAAVPSTQKVSDDGVRSLLEYGLSCMDQDGAWSFAFRFVSDVEMRDLHDQFLGDPSSTDIMTFPYDIDDGEQGGDILICVDVAADHASEHGWTLEDELRFLILHGLLHVLGWDDREPDGREAMLRRQRELLDGWSASSA